MARLFGSIPLCAALFFAGCASDSQRPVAQDVGPPVDGEGIILQDGVIVPLLDGPGADGPVADMGNDSAPPAPDGPAADSLPPPRAIERTLVYTGTGGAEWLHVFARAAGADSISVRTARLSEGLVPPYGSVLTPVISNGECKSASLSGTLLADGRPFTTTITTCFNNDAVQVSHVASIDNQPPGTGQSHGTASVDPHDMTQPYERSLLFVGAGGTEWVHVARRAVGATNVDVETFSYNEALSPAARHFTVLGVPPGGCKSRVITGTITASGVAFSTQIDHCRVGDQLTIEHVTTLDDAASPANPHGSIPIE